MKNEIIKTLPILLYIMGIIIPLAVMFTLVYYGVIKEYNYSTGYCTCIHKDAFSPIAITLYEGFLVKKIIFFFSIYTIFISFLYFKKSHNKKIIKGLIIFIPSFLSYLFIIYISLNYFRLPEVIFILIFLIISSIFIFFIYIVFFYFYI